MWMIFDVRFKNSCLCYENNIFRWLKFSIKSKKLLKRNYKWRLIFRINRIWYGLSWYKWNRGYIIGKCKASNIKSERCLNKNPYAYRW